MTWTAGGKFHLLLRSNESSSLYVAVGVEHWIAAQGFSADEALGAFANVLAATLMLDVQAARGYLSGVGPTPREELPATELANKLQLQWEVDHRKSELLVAIKIPLLKKHYEFGVEL